MKRGGGWVLQESACQKHLLLVPLGPLQRLMHRQGGHAVSLALKDGIPLQLFYITKAGFLNQATE